MSRLAQCFYQLNMITYWSNISNTDKPRIRLFTQKKYSENQIETDIKCTVYANKFHCTQLDIYSKDTLCFIYIPVTNLFLVCSPPRYQLHKFLIKCWFSLCSSLQLSVLKG